MAPPLAGKGTQGAMLATYLQIPHLSVGNLLRERALLNDETSQIINKVMQEGGLLPTNITIKLIKEQLINQYLPNGFVLDGFPRNLEQANAYDQFLIELEIDKNIVIVINLPYEQAKLRMQERYVCPKCGDTHFGDGTCLKCQIPLVKRIDDNESSLSKRYHLYETETKPLIDYYHSKGDQVIVIDGQSNKEEIQQIIKNHFIGDNND